MTITELLSCLQVKTIDSLQDFPIHGSYWGEHPIAGEPFTSDVHGMKAKQFSPSATSKPASPQKLLSSADLNQSKTSPAPSPDVVASLAYTIYENEGSQPGHEVKHWLEAEAQLLGGIERETQMHSGSSLFTSER